MFWQQGIRKYISKFSSSHIWKTIFSIILTEWLLEKHSPMETNWLLPALIPKYLLLPIAPQPHYGDHQGGSRQTEHEKRSVGFFPQSQPSPDLEPLYSADMWSWSHRKLHWYSHSNGELLSFPMDSRHSPSHSDGELISFDSCAGDFPRSLFSLSCTHRVMDAFILSYFACRRHQPWVWVPDQWPHLLAFKFMCYFRKEKLQLKVSTVASESCNSVVYSWAQLTATH